MTDHLINVNYTFGEGETAVFIISKRKHNKIVAELNQENEKVTESLTELAKEIVNLADEGAKLEQQLSIKDHKIDKLNKHVIKAESIHEEAVAEKQVRIDELEAQINQLEAQEVESTILNKELTSLFEQYDLLQKEINTAAASITDRNEGDSLAVAKFATIELMEQQGFSYLNFTKNNLGEIVALGLKVRGDNLITKVFYVERDILTDNLPTLSVRLQRSEHYDYKILRHLAKKSDSLTYDVEVHTAAGDQKVIKYSSAYIENWQSHSDVGSGNGALALAAMLMELEKRGIPVVVGRLAKEHQHDFDWLKPYLVQLGFDVPVDTQLGQVSKSV